MLLWASGRWAWRGVATSSWGRRQSKQLTALLMYASSADELLRLHSQHEHSFDKYNLSALWTQLGRQRSARPTLPPELLHNTERLLAELNPRELATVAHGMSRAAGARAAGAAIRPIWPTVASSALAYLEHFNAQELANLTAALVRAGEASPQLLDAIADECKDRLGEFSPVGLGSLSHSFGRAEHSSPALFAGIAAEATAKIRRFQPQELANTLWGLAKTGALNGGGSNGAGCHGGGSHGTGSHGAGSHGAGSHGGGSNGGGSHRGGSHRGRSNRRGCSDETDGGLCEKIEVLLDEASLALTVEEAARGSLCLNGFKSQEVSNLAWAYAKMAHPAPALFAKIAARVEARSHEFGPQAAANLAWAFTKVEYTAPWLFDTLAARASARLGDFNAQELANMAWAFARARHFAPAFFEGLAGEVESRLEGGGGIKKGSRAADGGFKEAGLVALVYAFDQAARSDPPRRFGGALSAIASTVESRRDDFTPADLLFIDEAMRRLTGREDDRIEEGGAEARREGEGGREEGGSGASLGGWFLDSWSSFREASEQALISRRGELSKDFSAHQRQMQTLGVVIKNKEWVYQAPPQMLYPAATAVRFPRMQVSLANPVSTCVASLFSPICHAPFFGSRWFLSRAMRATCRRRRAAGSTAARLCSDAPARNSHSRWLTAGSILLHARVSPTSSRRSSTWWSSRVRWQTSGLPTSTRSRSTRASKCSGSL